MERKEDSYMANQLDFIKRFSSKGYTLKDSSIITDDFLTTLSEMLRDDKSVMFRNFGKFDVRERKQRSINSVRTGDTIQVDGYNTVYFSVGKQLRDMMNEEAPSEEEV